MQTVVILVSTILDLEEFPSYGGHTSYNGRPCFKNGTFGFKHSSKLSLVTFSLTLAVAAVADLDFSTL